MTWKKKRGKEITTVINKVICFHISLFVFVKKVDTKIIILSLLFQLSIFFFDARRDFHVFLDWNINGNFSNLGHFDRSAEGICP